MALHCVIQLHLILIDRLLYNINIKIMCSAESFIRFLKKYIFNACIFNTHRRIGQTKLTIFNVLTSSSHFLNKL